MFHGGCTNAASGAMAAAGSSGVASSSWLYRGGVVVIFSRRCVCGWPPRCGAGRAPQGRATAANATS